MFEMKMPAGWKDDAMWNFPYGDAVNFVTGKYPWWPSGDDGAIRLDLEKYGTLSIVQVSMDTQLVPIGYTLGYARSEEMKREEGITYEGNTKLGGENAWEIVRKYRTVGDLFQRDIHIIHGNRLYVLRFQVISTDAQKRDNVTAENGVLLIERSLTRSAVIIVQSYLELFSDLFRDTFLSRLGFQGFSSNNP